jgi:hypothetical protein
MPKRIVSENENGGAALRVNVSQPLWALCKQLATQWEIKPAQAFVILLEKLTRIIEHGDVSVFGKDFEFAFNKLLAEDKIGFAGLPPVDISKLQRGKKSKSGFVGVYANGQGFRAVGRADIGDSTEIGLGTYQTAELAAWKRYQHYRLKGIPYGEAADVIQETREMHPQEMEGKSDGEVLAYANLHNAGIGKKTVDLDGIVQPKKPLKPIGVDGLDFGDDQ